LKTNNWLEDKQRVERKTTMIKHLFPAIMLTIVMTLLTGLAYPLAMTGLAGLLFPYQANGSLIERDGKIIGSELIGQNFTGDGYFHDSAVRHDRHRSERSGQDGAGAL
jgi:K+-transporting ATPase KdpC subunit